MCSFTLPNIYQLHDVVQYACINEAFQMRGSNSIECLYNGEWSHPIPRCTVQTNSYVHSLHIIIPIRIIPVVALLLRIFIIKMKSKRNHALSRAREFDACVCYKFDTDNDYVVKVILKSLEGICDPPLKLCVHERDFVPGLYIKDNIKGGITKSNSAIIGMSQAFIDSEWCQEEFTHYFMESIKSNLLNV